MLKLLYYLNFNIDLNLGVINKVITQVKYWERLGVKVKLIILSEHSNASKLLDNNNIDYSIHSDLNTGFVGKKRIQTLIGITPTFYKDIIKEIALFNPSVFYFRDLTSNKIITSSLKKYKGIIEINTLIKEELKLNAKKSLRQRLNYYLLRFLEKETMKKVAGVISVTYEIEKSLMKEFKITNSIVIPNSIQLKLPIENTTKGKLPVVLFIGTPGFDWHGIDLLLNFAKQCVGVLQFNIVGYSKDEFKDTSENINFHGFLSGEALEKIIVSSDVGIGTMALFRKELNEACVLKVREYLSYGLPVILPYRDTAFLDVKPWFVLEIPNNENSLFTNVNSIVEFCLKMKGKRVPPEEVRNFIDSEVLEKRRIDFIKEVIA